MDLLELSAMPMLVLRLSINEIDRKVVVSPAFSSVSPLVLATSSMSIFVNEPMLFNFKLLPPTDINALFNLALLPL